MALSLKLQLVDEPDAALVERANAGDDDAFSRLYLRHARYVAGVIYGITGNQLEVEDLVQEVFTLVSEKLGTLREPEYFRTWLVTITVRHARRRAAERSRRRLFQLRAATEAPQTIDPRGRPTGLDLTRAMTRVAPQLLVPWVLRRLEERPLQEIATICDASLATIKRRIAAAEQKLKRELDAD
jgi:RNA polymerase sigma-70 factor (ECF subfamily)